ncbi:MAG: NADP-dependent malic enzyme [Candidatus Diapherotrites archaeon]|uniref:NADP-dependent malic enzyme n=1 Tax=Candidatus Iainarchaeum sp. TaxID=3101447 RepID=A0A8T3YL60_9ARCH|nr:NADP-dependent malic enzyme [Candidatus Diapherotrites archaeon]
MRINSRQDLSLAYTPGVADPCIEISKSPAKVYDYTMKGNTVAVITDGTAVLGLGDIGPEASLPVMEGKSLLFKEFAGIDSFPLALRTKDVDEIVSIVKAIAPVFGGINLEDISAPRCFEIEERLQGIGIPVMHDDQHGTTVVVYAALMNALKVAGKGMRDIRVVVNGAGAAGASICRMLSCTGYDAGVCTGVKELIALDSKGIIHRGRADLDRSKEALASITNPMNRSGTLSDALEGADVFIGVSRANVLTKDMVLSMAPGAIVFAMANPVPEIMPQDALDAGAAVVGTGRSDFPNQINNVLAFPGIFRGALDARASRITPGMRMAAAIVLSGCVTAPAHDSILPSPLDRGVVKKIAEAVKSRAIAENVSRLPIEEKAQSKR